MLDQIRQLYPHLALAVYAFEPGGPVTVEAIAPDGTRYTKTAPTEVEALTAIFGPMPVEPINEQIEEKHDEQPANPFD